MAAIVIIGGALFFLPGTDAPQGQPATTTAATIVDRSLADQIPGFEGRLHAAVRFNGAPAIIEWEASETIPRVSEEQIDNLLFNADETYVGGIFQRTTGGDLYVGPPGESRIILSEVTAFAWHDTDPGRLAVTRRLNGHTAWLGTYDPVNGFAGTSNGFVPVEGVLTAYGEWGYAVESRPDNDGRRTTHIYGQDGQEREAIVGEVVASLPGSDGGVMVADPEGTFATTTWTADQPTLASRYAIEGILSATWSDDLRSYAELSDGDVPGEDVLYIGVTTPTETLDTVLEGARPLSWDPSGRFLATDFRSRIVIIDADDGSLYEVGIPTDRVFDVRLTS